MKLPEYHITVLKAYIKWKLDHNEEVDEKYIDAIGTTHYREVLKES